MVDSEVEEAMDEAEEVIEEEEEVEVDTKLLGKIPTRNRVNSKNTKELTSLSTQLMNMGTDICATHVAVIVTSLVTVNTQLRSNTMLEIRIIPQMTTLSMIPTMIRTSKTVLQMRKLEP